MDNKDISTADLIKLIGSPFVNQNQGKPSDELLIQAYEKAFYDRVAPLYLSLYRHDQWSSELEALYKTLSQRESMTLTVLSDLAENLNKWNKDGYAIFKSIKPYPSIPNDTDVIIFGGKKEYELALSFLYSRGYIFHEWAPMQTTLYDPRGKDKIGKGKKGGTYYIDIYCEISTDYVCYLNKKSITPHIYKSSILNVEVNLLAKEPELAIILFHNLFPERTFQLEHFYMPLYYFANPKFNIELFISFTEQNRMVYAVKTNLSIIELIHKKYFGFVPDTVAGIIEYWGRNTIEVERFIKYSMATPYLFSKKSFWKSCLSKFGDLTFNRSLLLQCVHMLNPFFFLDVIISLKKRLSEKGVYHLE